MDVRSEGVVSVIGLLVVGGAVLYTRVMVPDRSSVGGNGHFWVEGDAEARVW